MIDLFGQETTPISELPISIEPQETARDEPKQIIYPEEWVSVSTAYQIVHGLTGRPSTDQYKPWFDSVLQTENVLLLTKSNHKNRCPYLYMADVMRLKKKHIESKRQPQFSFSGKVKEKPYYNVKEISQMLGVGIPLVYREIKSGRLKSVHFAGCIRVSNSDLNSFLKGEQA